jgi:hypothetical protein
MEEVILEKSVKQSDTEKISERVAKELQDTAWAKFIKVEERKSGWTIVSIKQPAVWIQKKKKQINIEFKNTYNDFFENTAVFPGKNEKSYIVVSNLDEALELIHPICAVAVEELSGGEGFGCCSRYEQCSDERKCVNPDQLLSLACGYRKNLEKGKIFYGKNKNC